MNRAGVLTLVATVEFAVRAEATPATRVIEVHEG